jgi:hypothetical protein
MCRRDKCVRFRLAVSKLIVKDGGESFQLKQLALAVVERRGCK